MSTGFPVIDRILEDLGDSRDVMLNALHDTSISAEAIADTMRRYGYPVSASTIRTYRRKRAREEAR